MEYEFRDLLKADDVELEQQINEGFTFGGFDTTQHGWFLMERSAPTPSEKELIESVPYMHGSYDFSVFNEERYFENRELTYKFIMPTDVYENRKMVEQDLKRTLMPIRQSALYDTHDRSYHWLAKVSSIEVLDDSQYNNLTVTVIFSAYPFAIVNDEEGSDIWDDVYFPHWTFLNTKYTVNGAQVVTLINDGSKIIKPKMIVTGTVSVTDRYSTVEMTAGTYTDTKISIYPGSNKLTLDGDGTIRFRYNREEMI